MIGVNVMETTLRDGSYAVDFAFTGADTATICQGLEAAGFQYIEIGHGLGLRATERGFGRSAATDEEHLRAAHAALNRAAFGMFCIPGIARLEDVDLSADHGAGFIRVGTEVTDVADSEAYIRRGKQRGLLVAANLMKSYAVGSNEFADAARQSEANGADIVYLVDSAGCMCPEQIVSYVDAVRNVSAVPLGFHGHDNLGMAVYNSLRMVDLGAVVVDSSLQGLGRSAGNAVTEKLVAALQKRGHATDIDLLRTLEVGATCVRPILPECGIDPLDVVAGYAGFHSSFLPRVLRVAERYDIAPALLIIELCKMTQMEAEEELLQHLARRLCEDQQAATLLPGGA